MVQSTCLGETGDELFSHSEIRKHDLSHAPRSHNSVPAFHRCTCRFRRDFRTRQGRQPTYKNNLWSARLDQQDIVLSCMASACGGDCDVVLTMTPTGLRSHEFFDRFRNEINKNTIVKASESGLNPVVVDKPAMVTIDGKEVSISSVRLRLLDSPTRMWMMVEEASFGVVTLTCNSSEDEYEIARKTWLDLGKGIVIPKK
ncbi:hypothetical protein LGH82_31375 [Mesorhizobium sp. PAMC28654]|uniref:hypothetical protein n=1 Tax=Mesorhizobium sp. PAMC28654 TaxID=2880934 RepID=UPI001D0B2E8F|nr:hypothetical protein [Mesorhizobium sp. PAMC28654]UDL89503.1 hypothetical protein LGH82_31375 [Mesorhizobium sp. PAMC28654]